MYEAAPRFDHAPVWADFDTSLADARIGLLTSAGMFVAGEQEPFDVERERAEPTWGDPTLRSIPNDVAPSHLDATHLHINTADPLADMNVALPIDRLNELVESGMVGSASPEHFSVMGFQKDGAEVWRTTTGPEIAKRCHAVDIDALILIGRSPADRRWRTVGAWLRPPNRRDGSLRCNPDSRSTLDRSRNRADPTPIPWRDNMKRHSTVLIGVVAALAVTLTPSVTSAKKGPVYEIDQEQFDRTVAAVEDATGQPVMSGEIAGAGWIAQIPDNWNGDLLIWAHGFRGEGPELTVDPPPEYQFLTDQGFAWAASSYRRNSYDPGIGVIDTKNLTTHMQSMLRRKGGLDKTYLAGASMGGHVTASAIEKYPNLWDGALPACGVVGDVELFDYFLDYNVGSAAIAGLAPDYTYPDANWTTNTVPDIKALLSDDPEGAWAGGLPQIFGAPSPLTPAGESFKDFVEIGSGGDRATFDVAWSFWHGLASPTGDFFFDLGEGDGTIANRKGAVSQNTDMTYADEYGFDIDDDVVRISAANRVRKAQGNKPAPIINGTPSIPVLSIHTTGDLFVPIEMEQVYAQKVIDNGLGDLLVQRAIRDVGHCSFTSAEWEQSYTDLFNWVENGVKPAGEDLINDISLPALGCEFTSATGGSGFRGFLESCS